MCFDDVQVSERPARFDGEPRLQRLSFVKERASSRDSDDWLVSTPRGSGPVVVRQVQNPYREQQYHGGPPPPPMLPQHFQQRQPHWNQPQHLHPNQQPQFRLPPPQYVVPPPAPLPPPQHQSFGPPVIHQGNPHGIVDLHSHHQPNGWPQHRNGHPIQVIEPSQPPVRVIQEHPRARIPHHDSMGRRIVRNHSRRREQEYYEDDSDDDSFVRTVESNDSDDSFEPRRTASRTRRVRYYRR